MKPRHLLAMMLCLPLLYVISSGPMLPHLLKSPGNHGFGIYEPLLSLKFRFPDTIGVMLDRYWSLWGFGVKWSNAENGAPRGVSS